MQKTSVTFLAQTIVQFDAGVREAIREGGNLYVLLYQEPEVAGGVTSPSEKTTEAPVAKKESAPQPSAPSPVANSATADASPGAPAKQSVTSQETKEYTLDELSRLKTEELFEILEGMGIDPNAYEGRNTHKKLRDLILDAGKGNVADDTAPAKSEEKYIEISEDEWEELSDGDKVFARLVTDGKLDPKLWECEVRGWKTPKGSKAEYLHVFFNEDGQEDYLREGDKLYRYNSGIN